MTTPVKKVPIHLQSAQNRLLIKNGTVVNDDKSEQLDVYIEDSIVKQLGNHLIIPGGTRGNIELTFQLFFKMYIHIIILNIFKLLTLLASMFFLVALTLMYISKLLSMRYVIVPLTYIFHFHSF